MKLKIVSEGLAWGNGPDGREVRRAEDGRWVFDAHTNVGIILNIDVPDDMRKQLESATRVRGNQSTLPGSL